MSDTQQISIVVPFLNEQQNLPILYERVVAAMEGQPEDFSLIFVDDGSSDGSPDWVTETSKKDPRVKMLRMSRNFGHQIAITAGVDYARGDAIIIMDADLQDPPEVIPDLLAKWREGYEVVYAVRKSREGESWSKKFLAASFYKVFHSVANIKAPMDAGDFRLIGRRAADALKEVRELHRFVRGLTSWVGYKQCAIHYERASRHAGTTKYPVWKSLNLALDAVTSFSGAPLRWVTGLGVLVSLSGAVYFVCLVFIRILHPERLTEGWATLVALIVILGGIQLFCIGLLGQYVSRIFEESKKRPLYFVSDMVGDFER